MTTLSILYFSVTGNFFTMSLQKSFCLGVEQRSDRKPNVEFFLCGSYYVFQLYGRIVFFISRLENSYLSAGLRLKYDYS